MSFFDTLLAVNLSDGGGGGGTDSYTDLKNKPQINSVTLTGNKTTEDLIPIDDGLEFDANGKMTVSLGDGLAFNADGEIDNQTEANPESAATTELAKLKVGSVIYSVVTKAVDDLTNYYTKSDVYTKTEVNNIAQARFAVVSELPVSDIQTNVIYLVPKSSAQTNNDYDEYIYALKSTNPDTYGWEKIGDTEIDLSGYVTTSDLNTALADYTTTTDLTALLAGKQNTLTYDAQPTENSTNDVKSGGIYDFVNNRVHPHIYGVKWNWATSDSPVLTRTDNSQYFEPSPAVSNGKGSSPFDTLYPWSEMQVVEDAEAGSLVKIPKFWYKMTADSGAYTLQIADAPLNGFYVSPAHIDRGDGKGERDLIYVGRYSCDANYQSTSGSAPITNITRATARTNIHALGDTIYQYDYLTMWTIRMLYLVEYASFDSQGTIGYGCSTNGSLMNTGYTDAMQYHTGTDAASVTTYGGTQYRHIEGLWDNVSNWVDGVVFGWASTNIIMNPNNFADEGGTNIGTKIAAGGSNANYGEISEFAIASATGLDGIPYAVAKVNDNNFVKYTCDYALGKNYGVVLATGGEYSQNKQFGLFLENAWMQAYETGAVLGCRLIKLP